METIPKSQNHLAQLLGISGAMASKCAKRGMPVHSVEAARAWRESHLDPARRKGQRFDGAYQPPPSRSAALATDLLEAAQLALDAGLTITALVPGIRAAMHHVPPPERHQVGLQLDVMRVLVGHVLELFRSFEADAQPGDEPIFSPLKNDNEAQEMGRFWYEVAAGEWLTESPEQPETRATA